MKVLLIAKSTLKTAGTHCDNPYNVYAIKVKRFQMNVRKF